MSLSNICCHRTEAERNVNRLRNCLPEKLETFCKKHLSFLLDCTGKEIEELFGDSSSKNKDPVKKKPSTPFSKKKETPPQMVDRFLSHDQVAKIYQLSEFLQRPENIRVEGLFRKSGNVARQHLLKEWVNQGTDLHLDDGTFSPHDCATVLKSCISELSEPLLTEKHFEAHCQIVDMSNNLTSGEDRFKVKDKQIKALQLLFLLIPRQNVVVLECLLDLLHKVSNVSENLMTAHSLGMVFAPSLICPKKLSPLEFHSMSEIFTKAISFMIENKQFLFKIPTELAVDVVHFWQEMEEPHKPYMFTEESVPKHTSVHLNIQKAKHDGATASHTDIKFAERKSSQETQVAQEHPYAHLQVMPRSSKKTILLKQFNCANGYSASRGKHSRSRSFGESLKKHFPLRNKRKHHHAFSEEVESCGTGLSLDNKKIDSPAVQFAELQTCAQIPQTPKESNATNAIWQAKRQDAEKDCKKNSNPDLSLELISGQREEHYTFKVALRKKVCLIATQKPTAVISPNIQSIIRPAKSTQMAMIAPRCRTPIILLNSPKKYLESDL